MEISFFKNTFESNSTSILLNAVLFDIRNGTYKQKIENLRYQKAQNNEKEYNYLKSNLPAVTFSGLFKEKRQLAYIDRYSGIIVFDIDKLEKKELELFLEHLKNDALVYSCWVSPSNNGIKFLVVTKAKIEDHKIYFQSLKQFFETKYSFEIDKSGSDPARLCYVSYDPNLTINENSVVVDEEFISANPITPIKKSNSKIATAPITISNKNRLFDSNGKNKQSDRDNIKKIIKFLEKNKKSITSSYDNWFRVACAISNTFTHDLGRKYYIELCKLDGATHNNDESEKMLVSTYQKGDGTINFSTIVYLAQKEGFDLLKAGIKSTQL